MNTYKPALSRRKISGTRCIRCIRAKKGPCTGGRPTCNSCDIRNLNCVWEDETEYDAENEQSFITQQQLEPDRPPSTVTAAAAVSVPAGPCDKEKDEKDNGLVELEAPCLSVQKRSLKDDSLYESEQPPTKRKRGRPLMTTPPCVVTTGNHQPNKADTDVLVTKVTTKIGQVGQQKQKFTNRTIIGSQHQQQQQQQRQQKQQQKQRRTKLIHTEVIRYKPEYHNIIIEDRPPRLPTYMESSPLNTNIYYNRSSSRSNDTSNNSHDNNSTPSDGHQHRSSSPSAEFTHAATRPIRAEKPWILYFPRIYIDTEEVEIGPFDDGRDEWRRLDPRLDGGWMAYPGGHWVQERPDVFRWVR